MTREEAIKMLNYLATETTGNLADENGEYAEFLVRVIDSLDMAISALREQETVTNRNGLKGIRMMARPWQPQDLLDDLQLLIDEEPDSYLNDRRTTLCMARDFLKEYFAKDLQPESSNEQVTEPLRPNGYSDSEVSLATENQVTSESGSCKNYNNHSNAAQHGSNTDNALTNADHIRSMTDEELAEFWVEPVCGIRTEEECKKNFRMECAACFLDWLKQPYKEVDS